jgi:hypothetical protein
MAWVTPQPGTAGQVYTAAAHNVIVDDLTELAPFFGAWTSYTPTWSATTTNPVIGNGSISGRYLAVGKFVQVKILVAPGSTTTFGSGTYLLSPPTGLKPRRDTTATGHINITGSAMINQPGVANSFFAGVGYGATAAGTTDNFVAHATTGAFSLWAPTSPVTFANGNIFQGHWIYEAE